MELDGSEFPNQLSQFLFLRTYSRWLPELGRREVSWSETVDRYVDWMLSRREVPKWVAEKVRAHMLDMGVMPSMRALWASGIAADRDNVTLYNCMGRETEFITSEGVKRFSDFNDGDCIRVLTHTGSWKNAVVRSYGEQRLYEIDIARGRSAYTVRATRNHQWILRDGSRTNAIEKGMHLAKPPSIVGSWRYEDSNPVERYYWALGYVYGDGTLVKDREGNYRYSMVRLCGADKGRFIERFRELGFATSEPAMYGGDAMAYTGKYLKTLPTVEADGYENVVAFVRGFLDADGHKNPNGDSPSPFNGILSSGGESIDFIRSMFPVVGAYITREDDRTGDVTNYGTRPETSQFGLVLGFGDSHNSTFSVQGIRESTMETVWCLEVEDDHSFVLPNGIVTGNCSFLPVDCVRAFSEALYILMCGTGVGFSVESQFVNNLPVVAHPTGTVYHHVIEDSTEGWADALYEGLCRMFKGERVDFDYSQLRPRGAPLKTKGGRASGPEPLRGLLELCATTIANAAGRKLRPLECHDMMCMIGDIVRVGGFRRAALISFSDPEDEEMRHAKDWSRGEFPACRYMANNSAYYGDRPTYDVFRRDWDALVASGSGERGFYRMPPSKRSQRLSDCRSNPCVTSDTWVNTVEGPRQVAELVGKPFEAVVDGASYPSTEDGFWSTGVKPIFRLETEAGYSLDLTGNHEVCRVIVDRKALHYEWVKAEDLKEGDHIRLNNHRLVEVPNDGGSFDKGWLLGSLIGDGTLAQSETKSDMGIVTYWGSDAREMAEKALDRINLCGLKHRSDLAPVYSKANGTWRVACVALADLAGQYGVNAEAKHITPEMERETEAFAAGVLSGLFDADGCVVGSQEKGVSVRLAQSNLGTLQAAQRMLLRLGIASTIYKNRRDAGYRVFDQTEYWCQAQHELVVSNDNIFRFAEVIGFSDPAKREKLAARLGAYSRTPNRERFVARVKSLTPMGEAEVFDCTIPNLSAFDANGLYVHNCGEILLRYKLANDPFTGEGGGGQFCNLSAVVMRAEDTLQTLEEKVCVATWIGALQASFTDFPYLRPAWKELCDEDRLLGVDITGQCDNPKLSQDPEVMLRLNQVAREAAAEATGWLGINYPAMITCGKPSGNSSQLVDCASGFHPRYAQYYIRRVRTDAKDPLTQLMRDSGVPMHKEVGMDHLSDDECPVWVLDFPVKAPEGVMLRDSETAIQMLERYLHIMRTWCGERGHNQSITVYVRDHEWEEVGEWVWKHFDEMTGISFLPFHGGKYALAPYEEIDEATYTALASAFPNVDYTALSLYEREDMGNGSQELACTSGACEI